MPAVDAASLRTTLFAARNFGHVLRRDENPACVALVERGSLTRGETATRYDHMARRDVTLRRFNYVKP